MVIRSIQRSVLFPLTLEGLFWTTPLIGNSLPFRAGVSPLDSLNYGYVCTEGPLLRTVSYQFHLDINNSTLYVDIYILHLQNIFVEWLMNEYRTTFLEGQEMREEASLQNLILLLALSSDQLFLKIYKSKPKQKGLSISFPNMVESNNVQSKSFCQNRDSQTVVPRPAPLQSVRDANSWAPPQTD